MPSYSCVSSEKLSPNTTIIPRHGVPIANDSDSARSYRPCSLTDLAISAVRLLLARKLRCCSHACCDPERRLLRDKNTSGIGGKTDVPGARSNVANDPTPDIAEERRPRCRAAVLRHCRFLTRSGHGWARICCNACPPISDPPGARCTPGTRRLHVRSTALPTRPMSLSFFCNANWSNERRGSDVKMPIRRSSMR